MKWSAGFGVLVLAGVGLGYSTRLLRNLGGFVPWCPDTWNTLAIDAAPTLDLAKVRLVWSHDESGGPASERVVFANERWLGVPNVYGEHSFRAYSGERELCRYDLFKTSRWFVLEYRLSFHESPASCELSVTGPTRSALFEWTLGPLAPVALSPVIER